MFGYKRKKVFTQITHSDFLSKYSNWNVWFQDNGSAICEGGTKHGTVQ